MGLAKSFWRIFRVLTQLQPQAVGDHLHPAAEHLWRARIFDGCTSLTDVGTTGVLPYKADYFFYKKATERDADYGKW